MILISLLFSCSRGTAVPDGVRLSEDLVIRTVTDDVYLVTHSFPWPGNSLLVRMNRRDFVWADTPYTPEATALVLDWLKESFGSRCRITEINTGFHIDNLGGNGELIRRGIPVYGSGLTCELLETRSPETMADMITWLDNDTGREYIDAYINFTFFPPTDVFALNGETVLDFGSARAEIFYPGITHTRDNLVVYFPEKKVLFCGCMVLSAQAGKPGYVKDGDLSLWPDSLERVLSEYPEAEIVVPGHGPPGDLSLIDHTLDVLRQ
jgi:glyoxylase-like metal-dependent hydrolase (beta-lactamase superfamily II)